MAPTVKIPARDWDFEINTGTVGSPTWVAIGGLNSWSHSPTKNDADTTTFDDDGRLSHMPISRGDSFTLEGLFKEDPDDGTRDPGQEAVEAAGEAVGADGVKQLRMTSPGGTTKTFLASYNVTIGGGSNDDPTAWSVEATVDGAITTS
jgi:hypothetical protein